MKISSPFLVILWCATCCAQSDSTDALLFEDIDSPVESRAEQRLPEARQAIVESSIASGTIYGDLLPQMNQSAERLRNGNVDEETIALQREIFAVLMSIRTNSVSSVTAKDSDQRDNSSSASGDAAGSPGTVTDKLAGNESTNANVVESASVDGRKKLLDQAWGHLPPATIERLRSADRVEFLPSYRERIEKYFKRLGELQFNE